MSDCENKWIVLPALPNDADLTYGFVYIDPQAGFTLHAGGHFTVDENGKYHKAPDPLSKIVVKIRLEDNGSAALLPADGLAQLGLPQQPDWLKTYEDKSDPVTHQVNWGYFYNGIGDSRRALEYLEPAYKKSPAAPRLAFELTYAYNALGMPGEALRVSTPEYAKNPKNELLCREIAFSYMSLKRYEEAAKQYSACIVLCDDSRDGMDEKSQLAMNLSSTYKALGEVERSEEWKQKAMKWAQEGSAIYKYFHPDK